MGCLVGAFASALLRFEWFVISWLGKAPAQPQSGPLLQFLGARTISAAISGRLIVALFVSFAFLFTLCLLRALLRKEWVAAAVFVLFISVFAAGLSKNAALTYVVNLILNGLSVFLIIRLGLLAVATAFVFQNCLLENFPLTTQGSAWYAGISLTGILLMAALVLYAFYISLAGRPVFGRAMLEE